MLYRPEVRELAMEACSLSGDENLRAERGERKGKIEVKNKREINTFKRENNRNKLCITLSVPN